MFKVKSNTLLLIASLSCILFNVSVFGENDPYIPIHIDGFNTVLFNQEYPHKSLNMYSIIYGNPLDRFPLNQLSYFPDITFSNYDSIKNLGKDSIFRLQASGTLGSEYGDPMLNGLEGINQENRDHFTTFAAACNIPKTPMYAFFGYRYIDNYSDNFDKKWDYYKKKTGKEMAFCSEGLAYEVMSGYSLYGNIATTTLKAISYKHWGISPLQLSPLYSTGYNLSPTLIFSLPKSKLWVDFFLDYHKDYYNHIDFVDYSDEGWKITWERKLSKGIIAQFSHHKDSKINPSSFINTMLSDTIPNILIWTLSGNFFSNLRVGGSVDINYIQIPKFSLNVITAWDYIPEARSYTFYENTWPNEYKAYEYESATFHTALRYTDTLFNFPAKVSIWLNYCEKPLWETIEYQEFKNIIRLDTVSNAAHLTFGGKGSYKISLFNKLNINLWGNVALSPKSELLRFSLPFNIGTDITFGNPNNDSLHTVLKLEYRDRTSFKFRKENTNEVFEFISPAQTSAYLFLKMPFHFPLFREHLHTNFQIGAGPIRFSREQRFIEHPRGSLIGPTVSFGVNGFIN